MTMNAITKLTTFVKTLGRDTRGDDAANTTFHITKAGMVAITAVGITAAAAGTTQLANNANGAGDKVSGKINGAVGASAPSTTQSQDPFAGAH